MAQNMMFQSIYATLSEFGITLPQNTEINRPGIADLIFLKPAKGASIFKK